MDDITKRTIESAREPLIEEIERLQGINAELLEACKMASSTMTTAYTRLFNYRAGMDDLRRQSAIDELNAQALMSLFETIGPLTQAIAKAEI